MLDIISRYSGIFAIIVYSLLLYLFLKFKPKKKAEKEAEEVTEEKNPSASPLNLDDEDAVVASLIASIEYHNETHKNVRVVSVREVG